MTAPIYRTLLAFAFVATALGPTARAYAQSETVLHIFSGAPDGMYPTGGLIGDSKGHYYGTTSEGGDASCNFSGCGTVYELSRVQGSWVVDILYEFPGGSGGAQPEGNLTMDAAGNLYGVTDIGGLGEGLVYELIHNADGTWSPDILYTFTGAGDGANPIVGVVFDKAGNLYGTTQYGGDLSCGFSGCGTVFEISPSGQGSWTETTLHTFEGPDGELSWTPLLFDAAGNLYGATVEGGKGCSIGCGLIFKLMPVGGTWKETVLHYFDNASAYSPFGNLVFDSSGNLFGVTGYGGNLTQCENNGCGIVFELSPTASGPWKPARVFSFDGPNGGDPMAGVTLGPSGRLFGTTYAGGDSSCGSYGCGVVFELTPTATSFKERILHVFEAGDDGANPAASLLLDPKIGLLGTTVFGSPAGYGVIFEINR